MLTGLDWYIAACHPHPVFRMGSTRSSYEVVKIAAPPHSNSAGSCFLPILGWADRFSRCGGAWREIPHLAQSFFRHQVISRSFRCVPHGSSWAVSYSLQIGAADADEIGQRIPHFGGSDTTICLV